MTALALTVNGESVAAEVPARLSLADFIREHLGLTGTHLGCEHGVCGACTILIDGEPARSCIALAVAADGRDVRTIEGFDEDAVMARLRERMREKHGRAVRLLHAGHDDHRLRHRHPPAAGRPRPHPPRAGGEHLPLHRLSRHRPTRSRRRCPGSLAAGDQGRPHAVGDQVEGGEPVRPEGYGRAQAS